jgi:hypothetical protein
VRDGSSRRPRRIGALVATTAAIIVAAVATTPATAATVTTRNACQYNFDDYWRDVDITLQGTASPTAAQPGASLTLSGQSVSAALPTWMAEFGYRFGLLHEGVNEIPATIWVALRGTNTTQGVVVHEVQTVASTTITRNEAGQPIATPIVYDIPALPDSAWTSRRGAVEFSQAPPGTLPPLPIGPGGASAVPLGSIYIQAQVGSLMLGLDCLPGQYTADGSSHTTTNAAPFASVDVPAFSCIGRLPASGNVTPVDVRLLPDASPAGGTQAARTLSPSVRFTIPNAYLEDLYPTVLKDGANQVSGAFLVALDGRNTDPARQTAVASFSSSVQVSGGGTTITTPGGADLTGTAQLSPTTWTSTGGGALEIAAGPAGSLGLQPVGGLGTPVVPYGSVYARLAVTSGGDPTRYLSLDCASAAVSIANAGIAYSELGDQAGGDRGRFSLAPVQLDPFNTLWVDPVPRAVVPPPPAPAPVAPAPPAVPKARPATTPAPVAPKLALIARGAKRYLRVTATVPRARAGRTVVVERRVGRRVLRLAAFTVPKTGKISRQIALKPGAKAGATGIKGARSIQVRLRYTATATWAAASGRYRTLKIPVARSR